MSKVVTGSKVVISISGTKIKPWGYDNVAVWAGAAGHHHVGTFEVEPIAVKWEWSGTVADGKIVVQGGETRVKGIDFSKNSAFIVDSAKARYRALKIDHELKRVMVIMPASSHIVYGKEIYAAYETYLATLVVT